MEYLSMNLLGLSQQSKSSPKHTRIPQFNCVICTRRGVSLEQRTHRTVMFQSFLLLGTSFATVEDAAHRTDARNCAQRHRPVAFATEGLRLVLCFAFNWGIRDNPEEDR